jgi:hypothetical protein
MNTTDVIMTVAVDTNIIETGTADADAIEAAMTGIKTGTKFTS